MNMWKESGVVEHLLFDWPIEVYKLLPLTANLCKVALNDIIYGNIQHFVNFDRNITA